MQVDHCVTSLNGDDDHMMGVPIISQQRSNMANAWSLENTQRLVKKWSVSPGELKQHLHAARDDGGVEDDHVEVVVPEIPAGTPKRTASAAETSPIKLSSESVTKTNMNQISPLGKTYQIDGEVAAGLRNLDISDSGGIIDSSSPRVPTTRSKRSSSLSVASPSLHSATFLDKRELPDYTSPSIGGSARKSFSRQLSGIDTNVGEYASPRSLRVLPRTPVSTSRPRNLSSDPSAGEPAQPAAAASEAERVSLLDRLQTIRHSSAGSSTPSENKITKVERFFMRTKASSTPAAFSNTSETSSSSGRPQAGNGRRRSSIRLSLDQRDNHGGSDVSSNGGLVDAQSIVSPVAGVSVPFNVSLSSSSSSAAAATEQDRRGGTPVPSTTAVHSSGKNESNKVATPPCSASGGGSHHHKLANQAASASTGDLKGTGELSSSGLSGVHPLSKAGKPVARTMGTRQRSQSESLGYDRGDQQQNVRQQIFFNDKVHKCLEKIQAHKEVLPFESQHALQRIAISGDMEEFASEFDSRIVRALKGQVEAFQRSGAKSKVFDNCVSPDLKDKLRGVLVQMDVPYQETKNYDSWVHAMQGIWVSSPLTESNVQESEKFIKVGKTKSDCLGPMFAPMGFHVATQSDKEKSKLMEEFVDKNAPLESPQLKQERETSVATLRKIIEQWVRESYLRKGFSSQIAERAGGKIFLSGSFYFGLADLSSDIDAVCVVPKHMTRDEFFTSLKDLLQASEGVNSLLAVPHAYVPLIQLKIKDVSIDLLFARVDMETLPENLDIRDDQIFKGADTETLNSLNGPRSTLLIEQLVCSNYDAFRVTLRCVRFWAKRRSIYSSKVGFLGGVNWSILVAFVGQLFPNACPGTLLFWFFHLFSSWNWPQEIRLCRGYDAGLGFPIWDAQVDRSHIMPIITPAYPASNSSVNVTHATMKVLQQEFERGRKILERITAINIADGQDDEPSGGASNGNRKAKSGGKNGAPNVQYSFGQKVAVEQLLQELFTPFNLFRNYSEFICLELRARTAKDWRRWSSYIESRVRRLVILLEDVPFIEEVRPDPHCYMDPPAHTNNEQGKFARGCFYIALVRNRQYTRDDLMSGAMKDDDTTIKSTTNYFVASQINHWMQNQGSSDMTLNINHISSYNRDQVMSPQPGGGFGSDHPQMPPPQNAPPPHMQSPQSMMPIHPTTLQLMQMHHQQQLAEYMRQQQHHQQQQQLHGGGGGGTPLMSPRHQPMAGGGMHHPGGGMFQLNPGMPGFPPDAASGQGLRRRSNTTVGITGSSAVPSKDAVDDQQQPPSQPNSNSPQSQRHTMTQPQQQQQGHLNGMSPTSPINNRAYVTNRRHSSVERRPDAHVPSSPTHGATPLHQHPMPPHPPPPHGMPYPFMPMNMFMNHAMQQQQQHQNGNRVRAQSLPQGPYMVASPHVQGGRASPMNLGSPPPPHGMMGQQQHMLMLQHMLMQQQQGANASPGNGSQFLDRKQSFNRKQSWKNKSGNGGGNAGKKIRKQTRKNSSMDRRDDHKKDDHRHGGSRKDEYPPLSRAKKT